MYSVAVAAQLLATSVVAAFFGFNSARRIPATNQDVGFKRRICLYLTVPVLMLVALPALSLWLTLNPALQWNLSERVQVNFPIAYWCAICAALSFVFAFCCRLSPNRRAPIAVAVTVILLIQSYALWRMQASPAAMVGPERLSRDGVILQTSEATCVPAAAANVAKILGVKCSEAELSRACDATREGTLPLKALGALRQKGISGAKVTVTDHNILAVKPPAILLVLNDKHAVVYVGFANGIAEIWNPASGRMYIPESRLRSFWTGHAMQFWRP